MEWLSRQRRYKIVLRSKPDEVEWKQEKRVSHARSIASLGTRYDSYELYPGGGREERAREFHQALEYAYETGGWTVVIDELFYVNRLSVPLRNRKVHKLESDCEDLFTQGRSKSITVMAGLQRPVAVTRFAISQSKHVLAGVMESRDAKELSLATSREMEATVTNLEDYEFAWYCRPHSVKIVKLNIQTQQLEVLE
jgi:hypothetical protein